MNQEEEKEGTANNTLPSTGSDNSDSPSLSYLSAASLLPILEALLDSSTPPREDKSLLTPLRQSTTPRFEKPIKRHQKYISSVRREREPEAKLDHNNSALSGPSSGNSTDSSISSLASYLAGHLIKYIVSKERTRRELRRRLRQRQILKTHLIHLTFRLILPWLELLLLLLQPRLSPRQMLTQF